MSLLGSDFSLSNLRCLCGSGSPLRFRRRGRLFGESKIFQGFAHSFRINKGISLTLLFELQNSICARLVFGVMLGSCDFQFSGTLPFVDAMQLRSPSCLFFLALLLPNTRLLGPSLLLEMSDKGTRKWRELPIGI